MTPFATIATKEIDGVPYYRHKCVRCGAVCAWTRKTKLHCGCAPTPQIECVHRGEPIGQHACEVCGLRGVMVAVHQCTLLDAPCVIRPWTNLRRKMTEAGETACITCRERTLADGSKPWG